MQRLTIVFAALMLLLMVSGTVLAAETLQGKVASAAANQLTMTDNDGDDHVIAVNDTTKITLNGKEAKLADLKKGFSVTVTAEKEGEKFVAQKIDAKSATPE